MKIFTIEITDLQWAALADIVSDPDTWALGAVMGKVDRCVEKVVAKEQQRLLDDPTVETIPATVESILESHFSQPDYKPRAERAELKEAAIEAQFLKRISGSADE
jgi:hypothetical protein